MALARAVLSVLVLLGLTGCPGDEPPPICDVIPFEPAPVIQQGLLKVGQQARLSVMPLPTNTCTAEPERATSVTAEIQGPDGEPVDGQIELGAPGAPAVLLFTPVRPGPHHVLIAFASVGGLHQFDFHAMQDSSATAPTHLLPRQCRSLQRTLQGTWVCDEAVLRGEAVVSTFPSARLAVAGDVLWVVASNGIERYVDTGTDLVLTASLGQSQASTEFLLASPDELAILFNSSVGLYRFSSGTLLSAGVEPWSRPFSTIGASTSPYGILLRDGEHLALGTRSNINSNPAVQLCKYRIVAGKFQRVAEQCLVVPGDAVGFEPSALWTRDPATLSGDRFDQGSLRRWEWTGGRLVEQGSVTLVDDAHVMFPPLASPSHVPMIYSNTATPRGAATIAAALWSAERRAIFFEYLDEEVLQPNASATLYWGPAAHASTNEATKIRLRPQAPIP